MKYNYSSEDVLDLLEKIRNELLCLSGNNKEMKEIINECILEEEFKIECGEEDEDE